MAEPSIAMIPSGYKANKVYSVLPTDGSGDLDFARTSTATRVNQNGLIEEVAIGVPRLDYTDGSCPSLLLEPTSTNLIPYSEDFSYWDNNGTVITPSQSISPSGVLNASLVTISSIGDRFAEVINTNGGTFTFSFYIKAKEGESGVWSSRVVGDSTIVTNTEVNDSSWTKVTQTFTKTGSGIIVVYPIYLTNSTNALLNAYIWGAMLEQSSYPTSYIKTSGSQITRLAETANGLGNASTFNDSEGVLMAEISSDNTSVGWIGLGSNSANRILLGSNGTNIRSYNNIGGTVIDYTSSIIASDNNKIAIKYKSGDTDFYINGFKLYETNIAFSVSNPFNEIQFKNLAGETQNFYGKTKQLQYFDTALTDLELETLTSYTSFNEMALAQNYIIQ